MCSKILKLQKNIGTKDFRKTEIDPAHPDKVTIRGFTALHYACYCGYLEMVRFLVPHEIQVSTGAEVALPAPGFSEKAKYRLLGGSTCLAIALLRGHRDVAKYLMDYLRDNPAKRTGVVGKQDDDNLCTYLIACICQAPEALEYMKNPLFIDSELFLNVTGDMTPIMNVSFFGRPKAAEILAELAQSEKYKEGIYSMCLTRDNGNCTCLELCRTEVDYTKYGCTKETKEETYKVIRNLCHDAYQYAEQHKDTKQWADKLTTFLKDQSFETIFGKEAFETQAAKNPEARDVTKEKPKEEEEDSYYDYSEPEEAPKPTQKKQDDDEYEYSYESDNE